MPSDDIVSLFNGLFEKHAAQVALLDLKSSILAVNPSWKAFGAENGLIPGYDCVEKSYLEFVSGPLLPVTCLPDKRLSDYPK